MVILKVIGGMDFGKMEHSTDIGPMAHGITAFGKNGIHSTGTWYDGIWENGCWENGTWYGGKWIDGYYEKGNNLPKNALTRLEAIKRNI